MLKSSKRNSDFDWNRFDPHLYFGANYKVISPADARSLRHLVNFYRKNPPRGKFLEVGVGSNFYPIFAALPYAEKIDIIEYGERNVIYAKKQVENLDTSWSVWMDFLQEQDSLYTINIQQQLKDKVRVLQGSIFNLPKNEYDAASMHFVSESFTADFDEFDLANRMFIASLKKSEGKQRSAFVASFMKNSQGYNTPGIDFPAVAITVADVHKSFAPLTQDLYVEKVEEAIYAGRSGHTGMIIATGFAL